MITTALTFGSCNSATAPEQGCRDETGALLPTAPASARVDLIRPRFTNPTGVTNPLNPIGQVSRTILLGTTAGLPLRIETTRLPYARTIE